MATGLESEASIDGAQAVGAVIPPTDGELLMRFDKSGDQAALAELLDRHATMVWRVCRNVLRREQDAEDALQATFLILLRRAGAIKANDSAAGWLYRVALRTALAARQARYKRREEPLADEPPSPEHAFPDLERRRTTEVLMEELNCLPSKYQTPLVMRYLEGQSRRAIAEQTDSTIATVQGRLARGKRLLRQRLARRGISLAAAMAIVSGAQRAEASPPVAASSAGTLTTAAPAVQQLVQHGVQSMFLSTYAKPIAALAAMIVAGAVAVAQPDVKEPALAIPLGGDVQLAADPGPATAVETAAVPIAAATAPVPSELKPSKPIARTTIPKPVSIDRKSFIDGMTKDPFGPRLPRADVEWLFDEVFAKNLHGATTELGKKLQALQLETRGKGRQFWQRWKAPELTEMPYEQRLLLVAGEFEEKQKPASDAPDILSSMPNPDHPQQELIEFYKELVELTEARHRAGSLGGSMREVAAAQQALAQAQAELAASQGKRQQAIEHSKVAAEAAEALFDASQHEQRTGRAKLADLIQAAKVRATAKQNLQEYSLKGTKSTTDSDVVLQLRFAATTTQVELAELKGLLKQAEIAGDERDQLERSVEALRASLSKLGRIAQSLQASSAGVDKSQPAPILPTFVAPPSTLPSSIDPPAGEGNAVSTGPSGKALRIVWRSAGGRTVTTGHKLNAKGQVTDISIPHTMLPKNSHRFSGNVPPISSIHPAGLIEDLNKYSKSIGGPEVINVEWTPASTAPGPYDETGVYGNAPQFAPTRANENDLKLNSGDQVYIKYYDDSDALRRTVEGVFPVSDVGAIGIEGLGPVEVAGQSVSEAKKTIVLKLRSHMPKPVVEIRVTPAMPPAMQSSLDTGASDTPAKFPANESTQVIKPGNQLTVLVKRKVVEELVAANGKRTTIARDVLESQYWNVDANGLLHPDKTGRRRKVAGVTVSKALADIQKADPSVVSLRIVHRSGETDAYDSEPSVIPQAQLQPGGIVVIRVDNAIPRHPIDGNFLIEPMGTVALGPVYGRVKVAGLTILEAEKEIREKLADVMEDPLVQVTLPIGRIAPDVDFTDAHFAAPATNRPGGRLPHKVVIDEDVAAEPSVNAKAVTHGAPEWLFIWKGADGRTTVTRRPIVPGTPIKITAPKELLSPGEADNGIQIEMLPGLSEATARRALDGMVDKLNSIQSVEVRRVEPSNAPLTRQLQQEVEVLRELLKSYKAQAKQLDADAAPQQNQSPTTIQPGDQFLLEVVTMPDGHDLGLPDNLTVEAEGTLSLGAVWGRAKVAGKSIAEAEEAIHRTLLESLEHTKSLITGEGETEANKKKLSELPKEIRVQLRRETEYGKRGGGAF